MAFIPLIFAVYNSGSVLLYFGQDEKVVGYATQFSIKALPGTYFVVIYQNYLRWLNHLKHAYISAYIAIVSTVIYFITLYFFVMKWELEIDGLAYSVVVYGVVLTFFSLIIAHYFTPDLEDAFTCKWSEVIREIREYLRLAIPAVIAIAIASLAFQILVLVSGTISAEH